MKEQEKKKGVESDWCRICGDRKAFREGLCVLCYDAEHRQQGVDKKGGEFNLGKPVKESDI